MEDLISVAGCKTEGGSAEMASAVPRDELRRHYSGLMYRALFSCTKNSLNIIKKRVCSKVTS